MNVESTAVRVESGNKQLEKAISHKVGAREHLSSVDRFNQLV